MSDIIRKVRALLLKAEGTIGAESEAFMAKVRELMVKHQLEMHELRQEPDPLGLHFKGIVAREPWEISVCDIGAQYFGCAAVFVELGDGSTGCKLYGRQSACVTTTEMILFWVPEVRRIAALLELTPQAVGEAFALRLILALKRQGPAPSNGTDLVPVDEAQAAAMVDNSETEKRAVQVYSNGLTMAAAQQISLAMQTTGGHRHTAIAKE